MAHRYRYLAFAIVVILSLAALKATKTVSEYIWIDEPYSIQRSSLPIGKLIQETAKEDVHPPGYYLALAAWFKVFHPSLLSARAFSVVFYFFACSVFLLWCLKVYDDRTALLAAVVYSTSTLALLSSQYARMYTLLMLVSVVASWSYVSVFFHGKKSRWAQAGFVVIHALGFFVHYWFVFLVAAEGIGLLIGRRSWFRFAVLALACFLPFAVLWLPHLPAQLQVGQRIEWLARPGPRALLRLVLAYCGWGLIVLGTGAYWQMIRGIGPAKIREWAREDLTRVLLILWLVSLALPLIVSQFKPMFHPRHTVIGFHLLALPVGRLLANYVGRLAVPLSVVALILTILFFPAN